MNQPIPTASHVPSPPQPEQALAAAPQTPEPLGFAALLDRMTAVERLRAYRSGAFSVHERSVWTARFPEEAPLLNGEFEWIARSLADLD